MFHFKTSTDCLNYEDKTYSGSMGVFCHNCFEPIWFKTNIKIYNEVVENSTIVSPCIDFEGVCRYAVTCPNCGYEFEMVGIDPNILPSIALLNKKGYATIASCEGHVMNGKVKFISKAYVFFADKKYVKILKEYPLPDLWYIDDINLEFSEFIIRSMEYSDIEKEYCSDEAVKERMEQLYKWVVSLPYWKDFPSRNIE